MFFLEKVAEHIFQKHHDNISGLSVIFPNKRAGLFLKKFLAAKFQRPVWSPEIYSIDEFMSKLSGMSIAEPMTLLFDLYHLYKKTEGSNAQTPEEFFRWAPVLLQDFNEIDSYCVPADELFSYLDEVRSIELWNPQSQQLSEFQKQYLIFWKSLRELHCDFVNSGRKKKQAHQGLVFRIAVEKLNNLTINDNCKSYLFAGFNALTRAEELVINHFIKNSNAEILWDADNYYLKDKNQEAGKFLRKYIFTDALKIIDLKKNEDRKKLSFDDDLSNPEKEIEIIGVPGQIIQTKVAGDILTTLNKKPTKSVTDFLPDTAVILSDESLLIPALEAMPSAIKNVNITMGYPLKLSTLHSLWDSLFQLQINSKYSAQKQKFYHKDIVGVLSNPFFAEPAEHTGLHQQIISAIKKQNCIFLSSGEIEQIAEKAGNKELFLSLQPVFSNWNNNASTAIETCLTLLKQKLTGEGFEKEIIIKYIELFEELSSHVEKADFNTDLLGLKTIFNQFANTCTVPFSGEPLSGLQIMGILETRTLDFENVILLSANEDVLPSGKKQNSFIPLDIKRQFSLPTYSERDAIFAYHFYRLIQKAKKVFLLYNNDVSKSFGTSGGEKSRFITQILEELKKINPNIRERIHSFSSVKENKLQIRIEKNKCISTRLDEYSERGFSPSAINTFLNCPLDFYFKYIIGLREEEEVEDVVEAAAFGDLVHESLEQIFSPFLKEELTAHKLEQKQKDCERIIKKTFLSRFKEEDLRFGKNLLSLKAAEKIIHSYLTKEIHFIRQLESEKKSIQLLHLEKEMEADLFINGRKFKLKGKADRIDKIGDTIRIIDYKTGNVEPGEVKVDNTEFTNPENLKPKALQLMLYALLYKSTETSSEFTKLSPGIISLRKVSSGFMPLTISGSEMIQHDHLKDIEKELVKIVNDIYDPALPFLHSHNSLYCEHCME